jgi:hypothetical protein
VIQTIQTYRNLERKYPFCPGCSHALVLDQLNAALIRLQLDPHQVVIVTDIGCVGMSDQYFEVNAFHGLHGRAITYATGIKLANPNLAVIVLMGDRQLRYFSAGNHPSRTADPCAGQTGFDAHYTILVSCPGTIGAQRRWRVYRVSSYPNWILDNSGWRLNAWQPCWIRVRK